MTYPNELTNPAQANWPVRVNESFKSLRGPALYSHNDLTTTGLTEGFFGGDYGATAIADGTVALTNTTTNYIVAHRTTGTVSTSTATTNWNNTTTYGRVRRCVTAGGVTTGRIDWRFLESGIFDRTSVGGVGTVATDTIWDAAGDLVQGTGADTAARLPIGTALQVLRVNAGATAAEWAAASGNVAADAIWDAAGDLVQGTGANTGARLPIGTAGQVLKVNGGATAVEWGTAAGDVAIDAIWDAAGDLVYGTGANTATRLPLGTALHVLRVNAGATAVEWAAAASGDVATDTIWDAKGDLAGGTGANTAAKLTVGTNGHVLTADSAETTGMKWAATSGSGTKTYAVFNPMTSQPPASNFATLDTRNSIAVLDFDDTTEESVFWVDVMPEAASLGSGLIVNIFFMATSATSGDCRFGAQFERMTTDEDADSFDTATEATIATSGTSGIITKLAITCTTIDSIIAGDPYRLKIYRDTTGADTITGDVEVVAVELRSAA